MMRKALNIISVCMVFAVTVSLYAQTKDIYPIMKEVGPTFTALGRGMGDRSMPAADVAKDAEKLQKLFTETAAFMKEKNLEKAVGWANDAAVAAGDLAKAAKANESDPMFSAQKRIQKQCGTCHAAHREQLPDKTFKLKQQ
jgi:hypothetical protein